MSLFGILLEYFRYPAELVLFSREKGIGVGRKVHVLEGDRHPFVGGLHGDPGDVLRVDLALDLTASLPLSSGSEAMSRPSASPVYSTSSPVVKEKTKSKLSV